MSFPCQSGEDQVNSDLQWLTRVVRLKSVAATQLAVSLLVLRERNRGQESFSISSELLKQERISRTSCYRGLRLLEAAQLVSVRRQRGAGPIVFVNYVEIMPADSNRDDDDDDGDIDDDEKEEIYER